MRRGLTAVIGGVSQLYQGDLHFGRTVLERLEAGGLPRGTSLEHFDYGAVAVVQRLEELAPERLVLVGAERRERRPGSVHRRQVQPLRLPRWVARHAVAEAVTGYVTIDLLLEVASALQALPPTTFVIELEPIREGPALELSDAAAAAVQEAAALALDSLELQHA